MILLLNNTDTSIMLLINKNDYFADVFVIDTLISIIVNDAVELIINS